VANVSLDVYIVITLLCWSVWGILDKKALETSTHAGVLFRLYGMALCQVPLIWLYMKMTQPSFDISADAWIWTGLAAMFQMLAVASYLVAMTITDASLVLGATAAYPVVTQFLAVVFLGEKLLLGRTLGAIAIALGVLGIAVSFDDKKSKLTKDSKIVLAICLFAATFGWGIWGILDKKAISYGTPLEIWLAECLWECLIIVVAFVVAKGIRYKIELRNVRAWMWSVLSAVLLGIGRFTFLMALSLSAASYVIAITGCYPLCMYFMALLFLKERFSKLRFAAILLIVFGGIAVQLSRDQI